MGKRIGGMECVACGREAPAREQDKNGLVSVSCGWCGVQVYCRGVEGDALLRKKIKFDAVTRDDESAPAPKQEPKPVPPPKPTAPAPVATAAPATKPAEKKAADKSGSILAALRGAK